MKLKEINIYPAFWDILALIAIFALCQMIIVIIAKLFGLLPDYTDVMDIEENVTAAIKRGNTVAVVYPAGMILSIISTILYIRQRGGALRIPSFSVKGFDPAIILMGVVWMISTGILAEPIYEILPSADYDSIGLGGWACFNVIIAAPVLEEYLFRGVILESFLKKYRIWLAVVISSLIFGVLHGFTGQGFTAVIMGMLFAVIYLKTKSLFATIILHALNNAVGFLLISLHQSESSYRELMGSDIAYTVAYVVSALVWLALGLYFVRGLNSKQK